MRRYRKTIRNPETLGRKRNQRLSFDVTLDFHGYTAEEALRELEDELYACDGESVLIIHGKGDGILRSRIRAYLKTSDLIVSFEPGETANVPGGSGVTIART
jgi:DNA-nicking Smr family endonuclease